jgi:tetratricopeptide (TPR) repeat protein
MPPLVADDFSGPFTEGSETALLERLLAHLIENGNPSDTAAAFDRLHASAQREARVSELAFAYESVTNPRALRASTGGNQGKAVSELLYQAARFFGDVFGDDVAGANYLERALGVDPLHDAAFAALAELLVRRDEKRRLAELYAHAAMHRPDPSDRLAMLRDAAAMLDALPSEHERAIDVYSQIVQLCPEDAGARDTLEQMLLQANRHRDVAKLLEHALEGDIGDEDALALRVRLVDLYVQQLHEPDHVLPHLERILATHPEHEDARKIAVRLLAVKGLAARAAEALAVAFDATGQPEEVAKFLTIELEHSRGQPRFELLCRLADLREQQQGDAAGAYELLSSAIALDPSSSEVRARFLTLAIQQNKALEAARLLSRAETVTGEMSIKAKIAVDVGELLREAGDFRRARAAFGMIVAEPDVDLESTLAASRAIVAMHGQETAGEDAVLLADALATLGRMDHEGRDRQIALVQLAELCEETLGDPRRASAAWRTVLLEELDLTPDVRVRRRKAHEALVKSYEAEGRWMEQALTLEELAAEMIEPANARRAAELSTRAAEVWTTKTGDAARASQAWRHVVETYGPSRAAHAAWLPLLERERDWTTYERVLEAEAVLVPDSEKVATLAQLAHVQLLRTRDLPKAIATLAKVMALDPEERTSRGTLERLLGDDDHQRAAADVLEPIYHAEKLTAGLVRIYELRAAKLTDAAGRLEALDLAIAACEADPQYQSRALDLAGRVLTERVAAGLALDDALDTFLRIGETADPRRRGSLLSRAVEGVAIDSPDRFRLAVKAGDELAVGGDVPAAIEIYRRALPFDPTASDLLARIDHLYEEQGNPEERISVLRSALARETVPARRREILSALGALERDVGRTAEAVEAYRTIIATDPDDRDACAALAALYEGMEAWKELCDLLEAQAERMPIDEARSVRAHLAELAAAEDEPARARAQADLLLADEGALPEHLDAADRVARVLDDADLIERVLVRRVEAATDPATQARFLEQLGAVLQERKGDTAAAAHAWKRAAIQWREVGDDEQARALFTQVRTLFPEDRVAASSLVLLHETAQNFAPIPELLEAILRTTEGRDEARGLWLRLIQIHGDALGKRADAFAAATRAFVAMPDDREILAVLERVATEGGHGRDFEAAIDAQLEAVEKLAGHAGVVELLAAKTRVLSATAETWDRAALAFRALLGSPAIDDPRRRAAVQAFERLLVATPTREAFEHRRWLFAFRLEHGPADERRRARVEWSVMEEAAGSATQAEKLAREVLEQDPDDMEAMARVGRLSLARGDIDEGARALFGRRDRSEGGSRLALDLEIAKLLVERGERLDEAIGCLAEILDARPDDEGALALSSRLLSNPAGHDGAVEILERALEQADSPAVETNILTRLLAESSGAPEQRRGWYERLIEVISASGDRDKAFETVLSAAAELPAVPALWDKAEALARELSTPQPLVQLYEIVLGGSLARDVTLEVGERAVAFAEEWSDDPNSAVPLLQRIIEVDPSCSWAFDRLKLLFDAAERWDDLFTLYDRVIAAAEGAEKVALLEDVAQIAKDFAGISSRATGYLEQLLELKPGNTRLSASLERLYERNGSHRELVTLLRGRIPSISPEAAQETRARVIRLLLDELKDGAQALESIEELVEHEDVLKVPGVDPTALLERVLAVATPGETARPPRASVPPIVAKNNLIRQRAAAFLKERYYDGADRTSDRVRMLEIEIETMTALPDLVRRHREIAALHKGLGVPEQALGHEVALVMLEPASETHRADLEATAEQVGQYHRFAEVLVGAAETTLDINLRAALSLRAARAYSERLGDEPRAIDLFLAVERMVPPDAMRLDATRRLDALLARAGRELERLDVLERLARLEPEAETKKKALGDAAALATRHGLVDRAVQSWEARLTANPEDRAALDGLVDLFENAQRWQPLLGALERRAGLAGPAPEQRADRVRMAVVLQRELGETQQAIETWRSIEVAFGANVETTEALSALLRGAGQWKALAQLLDAAATRADSPATRAPLLRELGDVWRENLGDPEKAVTSYEAALVADPTNELARLGMERLASDATQRTRAVRALYNAGVASSDWARVLDLTDARMETAATEADVVAVLEEAAHLAEERREDPARAFSLWRRAFVRAPERRDVEASLTRLAEVTGEWHGLVDAGREVLETRRNETGGWVAGFRFRLGELLETRIGDLAQALAAFARVASELPKDLPAARATIRVGGLTGSWGAAARALVETIKASEDSGVTKQLLDAYETAAHLASAWAEATRAAEERVQTAALDVDRARDAEERLAVWYRDQLGDADAAEVALVRALSHDPHSASLLADLAALQRRARGLPLVDSLLRLSGATGGDLALLREAAETALASGDRVLARDVLGKLLSLAADRARAARTPEDADAPLASASYAVTELSRVHSEAQDFERVFGVLEAGALLPFPREKTRRLRVEAAETAEEKLGDDVRAMTILEQLFDEMPGDPRVADRLLHLYRKAVSFEPQLTLRRRQIKAEGDPAGKAVLRQKLAELYREEGMPDEAIEVLREALVDLPHDGPTVTALADVLRASGRNAELVELLAEQAAAVERSNPGNEAIASDLWVRAAQIALNDLHDEARALTFHQRATTHVERAGSLDVLARLTAARGEHTVASEYLERLLVANEGADPAPVLLRLADSLQASWRTDEARARLEAALAADADAESLRARLAEIYRAATDWGPLAALLTEGADHAPDKKTRLARLREAAELHRTLTGEPAASVPLLEQAVDLEPEDRAIKLELADALGGARRFDESRALLRAMIDGFGGRRPKERAPVHFYLARLDLAVGDRANALVELDAATRIDPANAEILQAVAELARDDGQLERAERSYRALLAVLRRQDEATQATAAIGRSEVLLALSEIADRQGAGDRALEILESALEAAEESDLEGKRLEAALRRQGESSILVRALEARLARTAKTRPEDTREQALILGQLATVMENELNRSEDALGLRLRALALQPEDEETSRATLVLARTLGQMSLYVTEATRAAEAAAAGSGGEDEGNTELAARLLLRLGKVLEEETAQLREAAGFYERARQMSANPVEALRALDRLYERLRDWEAQSQVLAARVAAESTAADGAPVDALYRLAALDLRSPAKASQGAKLLADALDREGDFDRAEGILRAAAEVHRDVDEVLDLYEYVGRQPGRERALVDALSRRGDVSGNDLGPWREASEVALSIGDTPRAEQLLQKLLTRAEQIDETDIVGEHTETNATMRAWAHDTRAQLAIEGGDPRAAAAHKGKAAEAADVVDADQARRLRFELATLAEQTLGDLDLAAATYRTLHLADPGDRTAWEPLLELYRKLDATTPLAELLGEVTIYATDPAERSRLRVERVHVLMEKGGLGDAAAPLLREIVDEDPGQAGAALLLAEILERQGKRDELAELLERQVAAAKDQRDAASVASLSLRLGSLLADRSSAAKEVLYAGLEWQPEDKRLLRALEQIHASEWETDARAEILERLIKVEEREEAATLALELHGIRVELGDEAGAMRALELGYKADPTRRELHDRLEETYRAAAEWRKLIDLYVTDASGRTDVGERVERLAAAASLARDQLNDVGFAAELLTQARTEAPADDMLLGELVTVLQDAGQLAQAAEVLSEGIVRHGDDPARAPLLAMRSRVRVAEGDTGGATEDLELAISLAQAANTRGAEDAYLRELASHLERVATRSAAGGDRQGARAARLRQANISAQLGDTEAARVVLSDLLKDDQMDREVLREIARVEATAQRWDAVSAAYRRLVALEEGDAMVETAIKLAEACEKAGRPGDARGGLERARLARPDDASLRARLERVYEQAGAYRELAELSLEDARAALDVAGRFKHLVRAGGLLVMSEDVEGAIAPLTEAHALRPTDAEAAAKLVDALLFTGRGMEASNLLDEAIAAQKGRRTRELAALHHRRARIARMTEDRDLEIIWLSSALDIDTQNGQAASELAEVAMDAGQLEVAAKALRAITLLKTPAPLSKAVAYQYLGEIAHQQGDAKRAVLMLRRAVDEDPSLTVAKALLDELQG